MCAFARALLVVSSVLAGGGTVALAAPPKSSPAPVAKPTPPAATAASPTAAPVVGRPAGSATAGNAATAERAVVFDPVPRPAAKDLQLGLEGERKAQAMAHYVHGMLLEDTAGSADAVAAYLRAIALDPANTELALKLAGEYLRRGETPEAIDLLKDAIKANPRLSQPHLALSQIYLRYLRKPDQAQKYAAQALELDPTNALAYQSLAEIYVTLDQLPKAQALLERAAKMEVNDASFWLHLARVYLTLNFKDEKPKTPEDAKKAAVFFQKALVAAGDNPGVIEQAASFYQLIGQIPEATALFERVLWLDPTDTDAADRLAQCYRLGGQRDKAAAMLERIIKINPNQESAYEILGELYKEAKQYDKALEQYEQSLRLKPNNPIVYQELTKLLLSGQVRRPLRAVEVLTEARRRFPDIPIFGEWLGHALSQAKKHQEAMTVFEQTLNEARLNQEELLRNGQFYFDYGAAAEAAGFPEKAAELFRQTLAVATDPDLIAETCNYLGYMWIDRNENLTEGEAFVRRALELQPENPAFLDSLGWCFYRTGKYDKALAHLLQAAAGMKREDTTVFEHIGDTYLKLENTAQALAYWDRAVAVEAVTDAEKERIAKKINDAKAQVAQQTQKPPP